MREMTLGKKILTGFILCGFILIGAAIFSYRNSQKFIDSTAWVEHSNLVINEFTQLLGYSVDAQTGVRGFIITGNERFLEPYENANNKIAEHLPIIRNLTKDNLTQQQNIDQLETELKSYNEYLTDQIIRRRRSFEDAQNVIASEAGKRMQDKIRALVGKAIGIEEKLLIERRQTSDNDARNFNSVFAGLLVMILLILVGVYLIITSNLRALKKAEIETSNKNWLLGGHTELGNRIQGEKEIPDLAQQVINQLTSYLNAQIGAIYLAEEETLKLVAGYAFDYSKNNSNIRFGQGLAGQAALEKRSILFNEIPDNYIKINSALGTAIPKNILVHPFFYSGHLKGVVEIGAAKPFSALDMDLLDLVSENIGIAFNSSQSRTKLKELLEETQVQGEELQSQQEELKQMNEELEEQTQNLKQQQEELQQTNEELEEQTQALELRNRQVEETKQEIEQKTKQLEISSKYKSEFLANMSHELRTPLNSLLILSKDLSENKKKNLTADQVESAEIVYRSGKDLLNLINEVLDLSKIEAGKMSINIERIPLKEIADDLYRNFKHQAEQKNLVLETKFGSNLPEFIHTDEQRLDQVLKNLMSNAIKFTSEGRVTFRVDKHSEDKISLSISDTGIGIPEEKQMAIFEAFQQADGGTSRKYGGTGLGLSISRELIKLLQGEIKVSSTPGKGSTFTITIPVELRPEEQVQKVQSDYRTPEISRTTTPNQNFFDYPSIADDRENITEDDKVLLVIEDDLKFASILSKQAKQKNFKCLSAATGEDGIRLAEKFKPHAIILDIDLPGMDGRQVLADLKANPLVRHIPVHIISVNERSLDLIKGGAIEYFTKPIDKAELEEAFNRIENFINRKMKNLLLVEDDTNSRTAMKKLIGNGDVKCFEAATGKEALKHLAENAIDCIVLDIGLPDIDGFDLIYEFEKLKSDRMPPIIVYTGQELTKEENDELQKYTETIIIKGVRSEERLLDETALFLHRTISSLPESKQKIITNLYDKDALLNAKKILLVDDDMRNVFAISKVLKEHGMEVMKAENGKKALEILAQNPLIDLVLMDIMMPEMDGYEAMQKIRSQQQFKQLPIIALTAKAMKEDRDKCIESGANDYVTKPIDVERLLTLMRVWLSK